MKTFISQLDWRFATKKFDVKKKVSEKDLDTILEAIRKAPSSSGLQPFHVFVVSDKELREKIRKVSLNQSQVTDASYLLIFCARNDIDSRIDNMLYLLSNGNEKERKNFSSLESRLKGFINGKSKDELMSWAAHQAYLALGFGLAACAELEVDSCPMEGFDNKAVKELLNFPDNLFPYTYLAVGYRKEGPARKKFRFPKSNLFTFK